MPALLNFTIYADAVRTTDNARLTAAHGYVGSKFDFNVQLYELKPDGEYFQLSYHWARASLVRDRSRRVLLVPGRREQLDFESFLLTSR
jgi:hypothetical protein